MEHKRSQDQMRTTNGSNYQAVMAQQLRNLPNIGIEYPLKSNQHSVAPQDLAVASSNRNNVNMELNANDQLRAAKFVTLMLTRVWRRRRTEVSTIQALSIKYQENADRCQNELVLRNQMLNTEQRRSEQLASQLRNARNRVRVSTYCPPHITMEIKQLRNREALLRRELDEKTVECQNIEELFQSCKKDLFHQLTQFRKASEQLANEQRRATLLELLNADLGYEILTIKEQFELQNASIGRQQEQLKIAHEALRKYEQDFNELEFKHNELKRTIELEKEQNANAAKNIRFIQNVLFFQGTQQWNTLHSCWYHLGACFLNCFMPVCPLPSKPKYAVRLCLALVFLLASFY